MHGVSIFAKGELKEAAYQGSRAAPGPIGWRVPPDVEPEISRSE